MECTEPIYVEYQLSLRNMAVLSSRAQEWRNSREARENERRSREKNKKLLPPQSPHGFSALARLYYLARPTKTAMLRRLISALSDRVKCSPQMFTSDVLKLWGDRY